MLKIHESPEQGFTIVEVIVTLFVITIFLVGFVQSFILLESQRLNTLRQAKASDIAYANLRKYPSSPIINCNTSTVTIGDSDQPSLGYGFTPEDASGLQSSRQIVTVSAPNGCCTVVDLANNCPSPLDTTKYKNGLVKITSTVTYGAGSTGTVTNSSYVSQ